MSFRNKPVHGTIIFGLISALAYIPLTIMLTQFLYWPKTFCLILWSYISAYGFFLAFISKKRRWHILFPLGLLFLAGLTVKYDISYMLMSILVLSWIRSGICYPTRKGGIAEIITTLLGAASLICFLPNSSITWPLCIWLFFLIQALYFILSGTNENTFYEKGLNHFDRAKRDAEKILSERLFY